jgi:putative transposase
MAHSAVRVRLDPTQVQAGALVRATGARRFAWNWAVTKIQANADQWTAEATYGVARSDRVRPLSYFGLSSLWTAEHPTVAPWSGEHSTWTFRYALKDAADAHQAFLAGRCRFPTYKARHRDRPRFTLRDGIALDVGKVRLSKYGWVRVAATCPAQAKLRRLLRRGHARLLRITVARHSDRNWYASLVYDRLPRTAAEGRTPPAGPTIGVDRGVRAAAVVATANGQAVSEREASRALRHRLPQVRRLQRSVSRASSGSMNRRKAVARLSRAHARTARVRANALHRFSAKLARAHAVVVVEDLATANLMANRHLASAIGDQGWAEMARQLEYKTARHGGRLLRANRWFASSKTCSACGAVKPKLLLSERTYRCDACGFVRDRDINAAVNLAAWGEHTLGRCPCVTWAGDRHPGGPSAEKPRHACGGWVSATVNPAVSVPSEEAGTSQPSTNSV